MVHRMGAGQPSAGTAAHSGAEVSHGSAAARRRLAWQGKGRARRCDATRGLGRVGQWRSGAPSRIVETSRGEGLATKGLAPARHGGPEPWRGQLWRGRSGVWRGKAVARHGRAERRPGAVRRGCGTAMSSNGRAEEGAAPCGHSPAMHGAGVGHYRMAILCDDWAG